jgi:hypothetical protein
LVSVFFIPRPPADNQRNEKDVPVVMGETAPGYHAGGQIKKIEIMTKRNRKGIFYVIAALALGTAGLSGCAKTGSSFTTSKLTYLSVLHMAPYAPATDIYLNGALSTSTGGIAPNSGSNQYSHLQPQNYDVQFKKTGSDSLMAEIPSSPYDTLNFYTLILYNSTPGGGAVKAVKINDDFSSISAVNANYRFFNMSPDAPSVDFYLNGALAQTSRTPADNVYVTAYNTFQPVAGGPSSSLMIKAAGTDSVLATLNNVDIEPGSVYTFFLSGTRNSSGNNMKILTLTAAY